MFRSTSALEADEYLGVILRWRPGGKLQDISRQLLDRWFVVGLDGAVSSASFVEEGFQKGNKVVSSALARSVRRCRETRGNANND